MTKANDQPEGATTAGGDLTRSRLLEAATALIVERGWGSVTTRAVAERAGVNQGLVHYHFGSMDRLLVAAASAGLEPDIGVLVAELLDDRPIPESIHRVMALVDRFDLGTDLGVLMAETLLQASRDARVAEVMGDAIGSWADLLEPRLQLAQERAIVRDDIEPRQLARVMAAILDGFLLQRMADPTLDAGQLADTLVRLISPPSEEEPCP